MANYISKLITQYFSRRHKADTEIKIQQWLIDVEHSAEKDKALSQIWEQINDKADKAVYASLKAVNTKIGKSSSRSWFIKHTLPRSAIAFHAIGGTSILELKWLATLSTVIRTKMG